MLKLIHFLNDLSSWVVVSSRVYPSDHCVESWKHPGHSVHHRAETQTHHKHTSGISSWPEFVSFGGNPHRHDSGLLAVRRQCYPLHHRNGQNVETEKFKS